VRHEDGYCKSSLDVGELKVLYESCFSSCISFIVKRHHRSSAMRRVCKVMSCCLRAELCLKRSVANAFFVVNGSVYCIAVLLDELEAGLSR
jgi:hypothetical protein